MEDTVNNDTGAAATAGGAVNNAGITIDRTMTKMTDDDWQKVPAWRRLAWRDGLGADLPAAQLGRKVRKQPGQLADVADMAAPPAYLPVRECLPMRSSKAN